MSSYRDLEIFNMSYELAIKVHRISLKLPKFELYEEGSQARRSSKGITSCIVEGYGRRWYKAEFIKYLIYAHASCDETLLHLKFIKDLHEEVDLSQIENIMEAYNALGAKINRYIEYVDQEWRSSKPVPHSSHRATHNPQRATRDSQPATRNTQLATSKGKP